MNVLTQNIEQIKEICTGNRVKSLFAFGSITRNTLKPDSDIDLIVELEDKDPLIYSDHYFDLKEKLEKLLHRRIDLLEEKAIKNRFLRQEIDRTKVLVYAK